MEIFYIDGNNAVCDQAMFDLIRLEHRYWFVKWNGRDAIYWEGRLWTIQQTKK